MQAGHFDCNKLSARLPSTCGHQNADAS